MKRFFALMLVMALLCSMCACAAQTSTSDVPSNKATASAPLESHTEMQKETEPSETQTNPQPQTELEKKTVSLTLPFMETADYVSFQPEAGAQSASLSLKIPADWTEDAGLFYCPADGGVRKVLEPICLLREMDDAQWDRLAQFDITGLYGEIEYLTVTSGFDANGRDYVQLLAKSWPEGGTITVWYPCFCFLRDTNGTTAVLTYYFLNPDDLLGKATLQEIIDSMTVPSSTDLSFTEDTTTEAFSECESDLEKETSNQTKDNSFTVEVSDYFSCCTELVPLLEMESGSPMWLGLNDETYKTDTFLLNYYMLDELVCFSMQSEDAETVTLYGNVVGCPIEQFVASMQDNGWICSLDENNQPYTPHTYSLGTVLDERCLAVEVETDHENNVKGWFLTNWPQGDYSEFYAQFDEH